MIQESIKTIQDLLKRYPFLISVEICATGLILVYYYNRGLTDNRPHKAQFDSAQRLLEWVEINIDEKK